MLVAIAIALGGTAAVFSLGCDDSGGKPGAGGAGSATRPVSTTAPATAPATAPSTAFLLIDGRLVLFPQAKLQLSQTDDAPVSALLYPDEPKDGSSTGNSYYLDMTLDTNDIERVGQSQWRYKAPNSDRADSPNGLFLDGMNKHLQPNDVTISLEGEGPTVKVQIDGDFLQFDRDKSDEAPQRVKVSGTLMATPERRKD